MLVNPISRTLRERANVKYVIGSSRTICHEETWTQKARRIVAVTLQRKKKDQFLPFYLP